MKNSAYKYLFRFCCDPGFNDVPETEALNRFVEEADIDDVTVFANVEELNTGHMSFEEQDTYLKLMASLSSSLAEKGITLSVNQWHSVMHADLGKKLRPDQHFRLMVDPKGRQADLCVCPLCKEWQDYIGEIYARYAKLDAFVLWVEDDFRLHNHAPLDWGGCFCEEHMRLYSEAAGKPLTREEFVRGVLAPGEVHPYRKIWLDISRQTLLSAAEAIHKAVRAVSDRPRIGLMSSVPFVHAAEGRDWPLLLNTLSAGQPPVCRVHLPAYQEKVPSKYLQAFNMVSMQCAAMLPEGCEIYPELENYPYSLYAKSHRFTRFQLLSSLPLGLRGITIDLYDLNGNGIVWEENYQHMLARTKPFLNAMQETGVFFAEKEGVQVLYSQHSAYSLHTAFGQSMEELYPREVFFAGLLAAYGIPFFYDDRIRVTGRTVAVSGQVLRNYTPEEITFLFNNNRVLLNGDSAAVLTEMNLGHLAGIRSLEWMPQDQGYHTFEQVSDGSIRMSRPNARSSTVVSCTDVVNISYAEGVRIHEFSEFRNSFRERTAPAQVCVEERVMIFPFGNIAAPDDIPPMLLNSVRSSILRDMLTACGFALPMVTDQPYLSPYAYRKDGSLFLYLVNAGMDDCSGFSLRLPEDIGEIRATSSADGECKPVAYTRDRDTLSLSLEIPSMETVLLEIQSTSPAIGE